MARSDTQIENRNFLSPTGFKFILTRSPKVAFFCNQANIPDLNLGVAIQPSYLKDIDTPGDKIVFGDLNLKFLVDENPKDLIIYIISSHRLSFSKNINLYLFLYKSPQASINPAITFIRTSRELYL